MYKRQLKIVHKLSGGDKSIIAIVTTATNNPEGAEREYCEVFKSLGTESVYGLNIYKREQADDNNNVNNIMKADCIFFVGGDQLRISSILGEMCIRDRVCMDRPVWSTLPCPLVQSRI